MWRRIRSSGLLRRHGRDRLRRGRRRGIQRLGWGSAIYCGVFLSGVGCLAVRPRRGGGGLAGRSLFLERTYAGRRSRARQRGARLRDTLAVRPRRDGELAGRSLFLERTYACRRSRARQRGTRLRDTLAVRPRRDGGELAGRFLFLERT